MNYEELFFKQAFLKGNKSMGGFALLLAIASAVLVGLYFLVSYIVKGVVKMIKDKEDRELQKEVHQRAVTKLLRLLESTNYTIQWTILKSHTNPTTYELTQHVNFVAFNQDKRCVEIVNMLLNEVLYDTLTISNSKDQDLTGCIVAKNGDIYQIQEDLENVTGVHINFRNF